jgi:glycosyltransferase involved in cell wall biosynthesis
MRMRIVHYSPGMRLELGGVVRAVLDWCSVLSARGHEVILAGYKMDDVPPDWNGTNGKPRLVSIPPASRPNGFVSADAVRLWEELLTPGTVAHLHCPWTASNMQMSRAARRRGVPYVVSIHGLLNDWSMTRSPWKKRLFLAAGGRRYLRAATKIHCTAESERRQIGRWLGDVPSVVLPLLVDLSPYQACGQSSAARNGEPLLLFLSRLHEQKGVDILIEAAALLRTTGRRFKLAIAGTTMDADYQKRLEAQIARHDLGDIVQFVGFVTGAEKIALYQSADLFVLPTRHENFGLALIEAMAAGTPVLTTRGADIWQEIAAAGGTISENNPAALCDAIVKLLADRPALAAAGRRERDWVLQKWNTEKLAADYEAMYAGIIAPS